MQSVRWRLTAWNGATITVMLMGLSLAAYALLRHGMMEQVDQAVRQQLRTVVIAAELQLEHATPSGSRLDLAQELRARGFVVGTDREMRVVVTRSGRGERIERHVDETDDAESSGARHSIAPALLRAVEQRQSALGNSERVDLFSVPGGDGGSRVAVRTIEAGGATLRIAATEPLDEVQELLNQARATILISIPLLVVIALAVGYLQARNALAPIATMTARARHIDSKNLHERLPVANSQDELGELAITFNAVLDRVDRAMDQQQQFTADASHELRTPVAIIRSEADVTLDDATASLEDYREALNVIRGGSEQLSRIVNDMFLLARADTGQAPAGKVPLYLNDLVNDTVRSMRAIAVHRDLTIDAIANDELPYTGDEELLRRALVNLLDNAIKYAPPRSTIVVRANADGDSAQISVTDSGPGVPAALREQIFDRFFRVSTARGADVSPNGTGAGLGLAIAREIVEMHGGTLTLNSDTSVHHETTFTMDLPHS